MILKSLNLTQFKNYASLHIEPDAGINLISGANGMGKTNLQDAIYYLALTKSYFQVRDQQVIQYDQEFFRIDGHFQQSEDLIQVVCKYNKLEKVMEWEGKAYERLSEHIGRIPVVFVAPDDIWILNETGEARRRFVDITISQFDPGYLDDVINYNRLLKQKQSLLKFPSQGKPVDLVLLSAYNDRMARLAALIYDKRKQFINTFEPIFQSFYRDIAQISESVSVTYESSLSDEPLDITLESNMQEELRQRRAIYGIHRDDLKFELFGKSIRRLASQGQKKTFLLALKLAQHRMLEQVLQKKPILLIDDIFEKLDPNRVEGILKTIHNQVGGQVFITDTQSERVLSILKKEGIKSTNYIMEDAAIKSQTYE